jgi:SAM-dependent methyltransferase
MSRTRTNFLHSMGHNLELYATFVVCGFLLVLKILHVIDGHWVDSAILVTLMLLAIGSLRDRSRDRELLLTFNSLALQRNQDSFIRWYTRRAEATPDMLADMQQFQHMAFIGISHPHLATYLRESLQHSSVLPWESVEVYFASRVLGDAYEGAAFTRNLVNARQEIAAILTDPAYVDKLPRLRNVHFFQQQSLLTHTGSLFGANSQDISVLYAVHSAYHLYGDTHQGLTVRLSTSPDVAARDGRFDHYKSIYHALSQSSRCLGAFTRSLWDLSATRWSAYAAQSTLLPRSAAFVASMISPQPGDSMLDIGSGSGDSARVILERHPDLSAVVLDGSPQMVRLLRENFKQNPRVRCALCVLPSVDGGDVDVSHDHGTDNPFAFIVIHQSLSELLKAFGSLEELVVWCRTRLKPGGHVLLSAHNTVVKTLPPDGFEQWHDPFRDELVKSIKKSKYKSRLLGARQIAHEEVQAAFESHDFELVGCREDVIEVNYEERRRLWHVPAVIAAVVKGSEAELMGIELLVDKVLESTKDNKILPRTVVVWDFRLRGRHANEN